MSNATSSPGGEKETQIYFVEENSVQNQTFYHDTNVSNEMSDSLGTSGTDTTEQIFQGCVIFIGLIGTTANGIVIVILLWQLRRRKLSTSNKFILNQLALDLCSCVSLVLVYGWKLINSTLHRKWDFVSCCLIGAETLIWACVNGSIVNLICITLERYVKIVHTPIYQNHYRNWMTYAIISLSWIVGFAISTPANFVFVDFSTNGTCNGLSNWPTDTGALLFSIFLFNIEYAIPLVVFIFCYWQIVFAMERSASYFSNPGHQGSQHINDRHKHNKVALVKTMIIITSVFGIMWSPNDILFILISVNGGALSDLTLRSPVWYITLFIGFLTVSIHPFIYGARVDIVRNCIQRLIGRKTARGSEPRNRHQRHLPDVSPSMEVPSVYSTESSLN